MSEAKKKPRKNANGYKMPEPLPKGLILTEVSKRKWILGPSIGKGGFGEIYSAQADNSHSKTNFPYVVKIEPQENGPLFVEMHFYRKNAKPEDIEAFRSKKKLQYLGMPSYYGSGIHEYKGEKYRFLVMDKFSTDIWKLFVESKRKFPVSSVFEIGVQILNVLEYIHSKGYIHADIKGANILLGSTKPTENQVYLVDFGLCTHFDSTFKPDRKKAHDGTIEYLSRDAHLGVKSKRGDLEILAYNLVQWLGCVLPWENIKKPESVQQSKEKSMSNITSFLTQCFGKDKPPKPLVDYLNYVANLKFEVDPDYNKLRKILLSGVDSNEPLLKQLQGKSGRKTPIKRKSTGESPTPDKKVKSATTIDKLPKARRVPRKIAKKEESVQDDTEEDESPIAKTAPRKFVDLQEDQLKNKLPKARRAPRKIAKKEENLQDDTEEDESPIAKRAPRKFVDEETDLPEDKTVNKLSKARRPLRKIVGKKDNSQGDTEDELPTTKRAPRKFKKKEDNLQEAKRTLKNGIEKEEELEKSSEENGNYENEEMKRLRQKILGQKKKTKAKKSPVSTAIKPDHVLRMMTSTPISPIANKNTEVEVTTPKYIRNCKNSVNYSEMSLDNSTATNRSSDFVSPSGSEIEFSFVTQRKKRPNL